MGTKKRYQITETQLPPVVRYIHENYPLGVTDYNIDDLTGANRSSYDKIKDVTLQPDASLLFDVVTDSNDVLSKEVWLGETPPTESIEVALKKYGYNLDHNPEWEVTNAAMGENSITLDVVVKNRLHQVSIGMDEVLDWLPELSDDELAHEPDPDEYHDRREDF